MKKFQPLETQEVAISKIHWLTPFLEIKKGENMGKNTTLAHWRLTMGFVWKMFVVLGLAFGLFACALYPHPSSFPDYDNSNGFILDYAPGDQFVTLKTMFLIKPPRGSGMSVSLNEPGMGAPNLEQYAQHPEKFTYVIRLIPVGTKIELIAIKDAGYHTAMTYIMFEGTKEWIHVTLGEYTKPTTGNWRDVRLQYNREYFRKIEGEGVSPVI